MNQTVFWRIFRIFQYLKDVLHETASSCLGNLKIPATDLAKVLGVYVDAKQCGKMYVAEKCLGCSKERHHMWNFYPSYQMAHHIPDTRSQWILEALQFDSASLSRLCIPVVFDFCWSKDEALSTFFFSITPFKRS